MRTVKTIIFIVLTLVVLAVIAVPLTIAVSQVVPGSVIVPTGPSRDIPGGPAPTFGH